ncbi:ror precursor [Aplysia californica]|uniref:Tyrosine-protein kinase receptor n=1 Tax=Aplysia californica TaxID=6500 RepID=Q9BKL8_APLCA|nr:ror precursor [Aplysia californica]AAK25726.1 ror [Aplysia californica]
MSFSGRIFTWILFTFLTAGGSMVRGTSMTSRMYAVVSVSTLIVFGQVSSQDTRDNSPEEPGDMLDPLMTFLKESSGTFVGNGYIRLDYVMKNVTKYRGQAVRIRCEITGNPIPNYSWYKDDVIINNDPSDRRMGHKPTAWGSRLKINDVRPSDSAVYTCKAENDFGNEETSGSLTVLNENPPPSKSQGGSNNNDDDYPTDTDVVEGGEFKRKYDTSVWPDKDDVEDDDKPRDGFCQIYRGSTCAKFVGNMSIYVTSKLTQSRAEEKYMAAFAVIQASSHMSQRCQQYGIQSLCYHAFPLCDKTADRPTPRKICRDECLALENDICRTEYLMAKRHNLIGDNLLPKCSQLQGPGTREGDNCIRIGMPPGSTSGRGRPKGGNPSWNNPGTRRDPPRGSKGSGSKRPTSDKDTGRGQQGPTDVYCYTGRGTNYRGEVSVSKSGFMCLGWKDSGFPELGDHNYCRNPNGREDAPWCFTNDRKMPKELCAVPKCSDYDEGHPSEADEGSNKLMYILIPSLTVPLALGILLALICFCQKSHNTRASRPNNKQAQPVEMSPLNPKSASRAREFPMPNIRFLQELGEGAFGKVYKGELVGLYGESSVTTVAIKTLKENALPKVQNDFRREVDLMSDMRHPNIVCLLGVCMKQEPMCMLFEYMAQGDLHEYLLSHSPHSDVTAAEDDSGTGGGHILEYSEMLHVSTQVAAGMEYLASHHFVHRDLAARNILVADGLTVKISDFGLSRDVYSSDYYRVQSKSLLPVRWMPPEAILYGKFTTDSDVWAFGVVLWEVFSYGLQPYYGFSNQEVIEMIRSRQILGCPEECPARIYGLMVECWHEMPARRPPFREIHTRLRTWRSELTTSNPWSLSQSQSGQSSSTHQSTQSQPSHHSSTGPSNTTAVTGLTGSSNTSEPSPGQPMYTPHYMPYNNHGVAGGSLSPPPYNGIQPQQPQQHGITAAPTAVTTATPAGNIQQQQQQQQLQQQQLQQQQLQQQYKVNPFLGQMGGVGGQYVQYPGGQPAVLNLQSGQVQIPRNVGQAMPPVNPTTAGLANNGPSKVSPAGSVASSKSSNSASSTHNSGGVGGVPPRQGMAHAGQNTSGQPMMNANYKLQPQAFNGGGASNISTPPPVSIAECNGYNSFSHSAYSPDQRTSNI